MSTHNQYTLRHTLTHTQTPEAAVLSSLGATILLRSLLEVQILVFLLFPALTSLRVCPTDTVHASKQKH